jgi:isoquinoline 1-oxidoreductase subunit alpha
MPVKFFVNGAPAEFDGPEEVPLLRVVREHLRLTRSKLGCGIDVCSACTMHLDSAAVRTCVMPVMMAQDRQVTTIEGLSRDGNHPVQKAWTALDVPQYGYCSGHDHGRGPPAAPPFRAERRRHRRAMTNLCRCATYARIRAAIHLAAKLR